MERGWGGVMTPRLWGNGPKESSTAHIDIHTIEYSSLFTQCDTTGTEWDWNRQPCGYWGTERPPDCSVTLVGVTDVLLP